MPYIETFDAPHKVKKVIDFDIPHNSKVVYFAKIFDIVHKVETKKYKVKNFVLKHKIKHKKVAKIIKIKGWAE